MSRSDDLPSAPLDGQTASETAYFREVSGLKSKADGADYQEGGVHGGSHGSPSAHEPPSAAGEIAGTPPSIPLAPMPTRRWSRRLPMLREARLKTSGARWLTCRL